MDSNASTRKSDPMVTGYGKVKNEGKSVQDMFNLEEFHRKGYQGSGIKVAILDSGLGINYQNLSDVL
jgi:hypothetical protein